MNSFSANLLKKDTIKQYITFNNQTIILKQNFIPIVCRQIILVCHKNISKYTNLPYFFEIIIILLL